MPEDWTEIEDLFRALVELVPGEREDRLATLRSTTPAVAAEVESLLAAHNAAGEEFLAAPDQEDMRRALRTLEATVEPTPVGPYRLIRELGRGGMGVVWLAERADGQFEQRVALKLIKRGMDSDAILGRFLHERQILARLKHPHIASLLDGGVTETGQPWFAMELVDGVPMHEWCDQRRLDLHARIRLFLDVCSAVEYAHANLIVHRDLKPSNVLISGDGTVKLLDFGIAKLLGGDGEVPSSPITELGMRMATPEYGAPEQLRGEAVTTATDVYSLGILLHELLSGSRPYSIQAQSLEAAFEVVCEAEPARPSSCVGARAAAARDSTRKRLPRDLRGDLDTIVMKALRKQPRRRYSSVEELAEDLRRYTGGLPIRAHPPSWRYRSGKFVHRHAVGVAMTTLLGASLVIGLVSTTWQARIAGAERDRAREHAERATRVKDFLIELFRASDPLEAQGRELTARDLLDRGIERIDRELADQPALKAELLSTVAGVSIGLGDYEQGRQLYERSLAVEWSAEPADRLRRADVLNGLGEALAYEARPDEAERIHREALAERRRFAGAESAASAESLNNLGVALAMQHRWIEAQECYEPALATQRRLLGELDRNTLTTEYNFGVALIGQGKNAQAVSILRSAADRRRVALGPNDPEVAGSLNALGTAYLGFGDYEAAVTTYREALELRRRILGETHPLTLATLNNLAYAYESTGREREAAEILRTVLAHDLEQLGPGHTYVAMDRDNLGGVLTELGRSDEAMYLFEEASAVHLANSGPDHPTLGRNLMRQAEALRLRGELPLAAERIDHALEIFTAKRDMDPGRIAAATALSGAIRAALGRADEAETLYRRALAMQDDIGGGDHPDSVITLHGLGDLLLDEGRAAEADEVLRRALEIGDARLPESHWRRGELQVSNALCQLALGHSTEAETLLAEGLAHLRRTRGPDDWRTLAAERRARAGTG